jgi:hypothetical protein
MIYDILALKKPLLAITDEQGALAKEMTFLNMPYFCSSIEATAMLLTNLIKKTQPFITDDALQSRNRYCLNQQLSDILISAQQTP